MTRIGRQTSSENVLAQTNNHILGREKGLNMDAVMSLYKGMLVPTLPYGGETLKWYD